MQTSDAQIKKILKTESFRATAYPDGSINGVQQHSIGYGHQIHTNETSLLSGSITPDKALQLFKNDLSPLEDQINNGSDYPLNQNEFDSLVDFGFNCGGGALNLVLATWNNTGGPAQTIARMSLYNKSAVAGVKQINAYLVARRADESKTFMSAVTSNPLTSLAVVAIAGFAAFRFFS